MSGYFSRLARRSAPMMSGGARIQNVASHSEVSAESVSEVPQVQSAHVDMQASVAPPAPPVLARDPQPSPETPRAPSPPAESPAPKTVRLEAPAGVEHQTVMPQAPARKDKENLAVEPNVPGIVEVEAQVPAPRTELPLVRPAAMIQPDVEPERESALPKPGEPAAPRAGSPVENVREIAASTAPVRPVPNEERETTASVKTAAIAEQKAIAPGQPEFPAVASVLKTPPARQFEVEPPRFAARYSPKPAENKVEVNIGSVLVEIRNQAPAPAAAPRRVNKRPEQRSANRSRLSRYYLRGS